ncbi:MAG TPA: GAF domain-containing protein [Chloroflexi bacterium]|nr:GAF domain-containing protein [Chloroflexota bacterium]
MAQHKTKLNNSTMQTALYHASSVFLEQVDVKTTRQNICQLVIDKFGLEMAWLGLVNENDFNVHPVTCCGFQEGYLDSIRITWDDSPTGQGPTGAAIRTGKAVPMNRIDTDPAYALWRPAALAQGYRSSAALPLSYGKKMLGALNVYSKSPSHFTPERLQELQSFANLAAVALQKATLYEQVQHHAEELEQRVSRRTAELTEANQILELEIAERERTEADRARFTNKLRIAAEVSTQLAAILDIEDLLSNVVALLQSRFKLYHVHVYLLDESGDTLVVRVGSGDIGKKLREQRHVIPLNRERSLVARAARLQQTLVVGDVHTDPYFMSNPLLPDTHSEVAVPLIAGDRTLGVLDLQDNRLNRFTQSDLDTFSALAGQIAIAVQNAHLFEEQKRVEKALREGETRYRNLALENARLLEQARQDAETKAVLLKEVNHRVKNNLAAIVGMLYIERRHIGIEAQATYQRIMKDLINRIEGLATVHHLLSEFEWAPVPLNQLAEQVVASALQALPPDKYIRVDIPQSSRHVSPKQANGLAMVINELATNTIKHALTGRKTAQINIRIAEDENKDILFEFQDDGPGFSERALCLEYQNIGMYLIQNIVRKDLRGEVSLNNTPGATISIHFPASLTL